MSSGHTPLQPNWKPQRKTGDCRVVCFFDRLTWGNRGGTAHKRSCLAQRQRAHTNCSLALSSAFFVWPHACHNVAESHRLATGRARVSGRRGVGRIGLQGGGTRPYPRGRSPDFFRGAQVQQERTHASSSRCEKSDGAVASCTIAGFVFDFRYWARHEVSPRPCKEYMDTNPHAPKQAEKQRRLEAKNASRKGREEN